MPRGGRCAEAGGRHGLCAVHRGGAGRGQFVIEHITSAALTHSAGGTAQRRAGAKGFGLFTEEALGEGQFVIEYIGEVLEEEEYLRRKEFYQASGQRHYYFMNVGNGEVIDACRKARPVCDTSLAPCM